MIDLSKKNKVPVVNYKFEEFLNDPEADVSTSVIASRGFGFCLTLKPPSRWQKIGDVLFLPFGGIGGKIEPGESPLASLYREVNEEIGSGVEITTLTKETILMQGKTIELICLSTNLPEPMPFIIFRTSRVEAGRKPFTNNLIYTGNFPSNAIKSIKPIDDPALIEIKHELLLLLFHQPMSVKKFRLMGGKITSRITLPEDGLLKPIGTAIAISLCLEAKNIHLAAANDILKSF